MLISIKILESNQDVDFWNHHTFAYNTHLKMSFSFDGRISTVMPSTTNTDDCTLQYEPQSLPKYAFCSPCTCACTPLSLQIATTVSSSRSSCIAMQCFLLSYYFSCDILLIARTICRVHPMPAVQSMQIYKLLNTSYLFLLFPPLRHM